MCSSTAVALLRLVCVLMLPVLAAAAQDDPAPLRIHIIGASVSGGFRDGPMFSAETQGDSVELQQILRRWCGDRAKVTTHAPMEMWNLFRDPLGIGGKEITLALRAGPDILVAVDFLFWFAYGYVQGDESEARGELLTKGFALLDKFEGPLLIGDLPDMSGAAQRMLHPRQVPSAAVLQALNARIAGYAQERRRCPVVPLAALVRTMKTDGAVLPLAAGPLRTSPGALLQEDRLHATRLGMALLGYTIQEPLRGLIPAGNPLREQQWAFEQFVAAAGAEDELDGLVAARR